METLIEKNVSYLASDLPQDGILRSDVLVEVLLPCF